jgi:signal transduction histidine kinase
MWHPLSMLTSVPLPHPREDQRLRTLAACDLLDTAPEEVFDRLASIAAQICGCPIALVNLVDRERQWFKAAIGVDVRSTPREISFCAHAVARGEPMIVEDALLDPRFRENPLVVGPPKVRFYAGVPICADSLPLGTLCVIDIVPRTLTAPQREALTALAREVEAQIELRRALQRSERLGEQRHQLGCMIVHDMRGPLTVALTGAEYLAASERLSPAERRIVNQMMSAARTLERMARDLLDVSQSESGRLESRAEQVSLKSFSEQIASALQSITVEHHLVFRAAFSPDDQATTDPDFVRRIAFNLVENAAKYAPRDSEITVDMSLVRSTSLRVSVRDHGPGVPLDARERIFDTAFRLERDASTRARTSYGLGLRFCKVAAEAMNGRIWVEDNSPSGAHFIAEFPSA